MVHNNKNKINEIDKDLKENPFHKFLKSQSRHVVGYVTWIETLFIWLSLL